MNPCMFAVNLESVICGPPSKWEQKFLLIFFPGVPDLPDQEYYIIQKRSIVHTFFLSFIEVQDIFIQMNMIILDIADISPPDPCGCCLLEQQFIFQNINHSQKLREFFFCEGRFSGSIAFLFFYCAGKYFQWIINDYEKKKRNFPLLPGGGKLKIFYRKKLNNM